MMCVSRDKIEKKTMAYLHCRTRTGIPSRIRTPNPMATLYCTETVQIAHTRTSYSNPDMKYQLLLYPYWGWISIPDRDPSLCLAM